MADSNTFYYLNSLDKDVDNDILTSLCFEFGNDEKHFDYAGISLACSVMPLKHMNCSTHSRKYIYRAIRDRDMQWCP